MPTRLLALGALLLASGCVTKAHWRPGPARVTTALYDERGRQVKPADATAPYRILGLGPRQPDPITDPQDQQMSPEERQRRREAKIRNQFGPTVLIQGELVTKRYFLSGETGAIFFRLMGMATEPPTDDKTKLGGADGKPSILSSMLGDNSIEVRYLKDFEVVPGALGGQVKWPQGPVLPVNSPEKESNDLLVVTAKPQALKAFEDALNLFYSNVPQVEIEVKVVEFSTSESTAFGTGGDPTGNPNSAAPGKTTNRQSGRLVREIISAFPLVPPVGGGVNSRGLITLGGIHDGWELETTIQALQAQGKADVLSSPRLVVRNGGTASISTSTDVPFPQAKVTVNQVSSTNISFKPVGITLGIKPVIAGTDTVILQIHADVSAVTGFADTDPIDTPIVSRRTAVTSVHVPNNKTTIIGGLRTTSSFENEAKIPLLGDIPILGFLFRSTTTQTTESELKFFITPRIRIGDQDVLAR
ncbi:MAG: type II and III secretion system protein [Planctomycetes bacterium]|nr:type II and III secretion system protein [Planctomycetota bacterium]MCB9871956.1 type II and III secretion system protein [Planctomycetota bacterium]MCB9889545.1 type II and III secretion system protein [Planctomycetota bacterium]